MKYIAKTNLSEYLLRVTAVRRLLWPWILSFYIYTSYCPLCHKNGSFQKYRKQIAISGKMTVEDDLIETKLR